MIHQLKMEILLAIKGSIVEVGLKKSDLLHSHAGSGLFATRSMGKVGIVGNYFGSLEYKYLSSCGSSSKAYSECIMRVTRARFWK